MADRAAFALRLMLKDKWSRLFAMARHATFVQACHRQSTRGFENVAPVRIMALHTVYPVFNDRMTVRQIELRVGLKVALKTRGGILARIDDKNSASAACRHVFAARAVA